MKKETRFTLTIQGGVLRGTNKTGKKQHNTKKKSSKCSLKPSGVISYQERCTGALSRSMKRSKVRLAQLIGSISNRPSYHCSVVLPSEGRGYFERIILTDCLKRFFEQINKIYPNSYSIKTYGWTPEAGLHAHILMRFGKKSTRKDKERVLREIWGEITGDHSPTLLKLTKFCEKATIGYLTSPQKDTELRRVIQRLNGRRIWSIHNRYNIRWHEMVTLKLTHREHNVFKFFLQDMFKKHKIEASNGKQLNKQSYCLNYLPPDLLNKALNKFLEWRKRHES